MEYFPSEHARSKAMASPNHPYDFDVHNSQSRSWPSWRELIHSSWRDDDYRRMVMAYLIEAVYVLELERQEKRKEQGIAQQWWKPFKYKLAHELVDERDGSIFGAIFEWDHFSDSITHSRPSGAPSAIMAFRGTLLRTPTFRRDIEDELRLLAWDSLKCSVRFTGALKALKTTIDKFGSDNVCLCGHSLGAGFARQAGKILTRQMVPLEFYLFNAPYVSLPMSLRSIVKKAACLSKMLRSRLASIEKWHARRMKSLKNVAYANCILGYTRLEYNKR